MGWTAISLPQAWDDNPWSPPFNSYLELVDLVPMGAGFVAFGNDARGGVVWTSADGAMWNRLPETAMWDGTRIDKVLAWPGGLLAAGSDGGERAAFWVSPDAITWQRAPDSQDLEFYLGPDRYYYGGAVSDLRMDGAELVAEGGPGCDCGGLASASGARALAVMTAQAGRARVTWRSGDGLHWSREQRALDQWGGRPPASEIATDSGRLRLNWDENGNESVIEASSDGTTWRQVYRAESTAQFNRLVKVAGGYLAVGVYYVENDFGTDHALAVFSPDGSTWTRSTGWPDLVGGRMATAASNDQLTLALGSRQAGAGPTVWVSPPLATAPVQGGKPAEPPGGLRTVSGTWQDEPKLPHALSWVTALALPDDRLAVFPKPNEGDNENAFIFDPTTGQTEAIAEPPESLAEAPMVALEDGTVLAFARHILAWSPGSNRWTVRTAKSPRRGSAAVGPDGFVYVADEFSYGSAVPYSYEVTVYDPANDRWRESVAMPPWTGSGGSHDAHMTVVSGADVLYGLTEARVWKFSASEWQEGPALLRAGYALSGAAVLPDGRLVIAHSDVVGPECATTNDVKTTIEVLDEAGMAWSDGPAMAGRVGFSMVADSGGLLHFVGGFIRTLDGCGGWSGNNEDGHVLSLSLSH